MKIFRNRTVIGVLCILLALVICFGVTPLFSRSASEKAEIVRVTAETSRRATRLPLRWDRLWRWAPITCRPAS